MKTYIGDDSADLSRLKATLKSAAFCLGVCLGASLGIIGCAGNSSGTSSSSTISATSETVRAGETITFRMDGADAGQGQWKVVGASTNGTIDQNGVFQAPATVPQPNSISISYVVGAKTFTHQVQITNPVPIVSNVAPNVIRMPISTITVSGSKFVRNSTVLVNGNAVPTTFINSGSLQATVVVPAQTALQLSITVGNPDPGPSASSAIPLPVTLQPLSVSPSIVTGGAVNLTISGLQFSGDVGATIDDRPLSVASSSDTAVSAIGFLPPWHTGTAKIRLFSKSTSADLAEIQIPIAQTATSFDTAARFLTQAGFGPRPDLVQHVQTVGLDAFITEQQSMPVQPYKSTDRGIITMMERSVLGSNPLRMRVAWALQTFLIRAGISAQSSNYPFEAKMEVDATGNFRDLLTDVSSDVSIAQLLTLAGNAAPKDPSVHPNQNFARELLQLFTIGTAILNDDGTVQTDLNGSPNPAYDQTTILDLSRVFTGWNYPPSGDPGYTFYGVDWSAPLVANENQHDKGQKQLFGNVTLPAGQTASQDRAMALDAIFAHPNLPPFVSRILIQRLVKSDPSPEYVKRIATVFKDDGRGVRGNLSAVVRAILLDPEARRGDTEPSPTDGFLQEPYLFETFAMSITGWTSTDVQPSYVPCALAECIYYAPTVFGFYSPSYRIPGTTVNSPEFQILNDITLINRSQILWAMITGQQGGFTGISKSSWLYQNFTTVPQLVDALNHLVYHGQMSTQEQQLIVNYCSQLQTADPLLPAESAIFLALNGDNYTVSH